MLMAERLKADPAERNYELWGMGFRISTFQGSGGWLIAQKDRYGGWKAL